MKKNSIVMAHLADTHIKNLKYHSEYKEVFVELYEKLREENVDYIIHCGDIAHTKTQLSPEYFDLTSDFLKNLADIAPTHIILGNHDGNCRNYNRQDALTPIITALQHPNLFLHKRSGEVILNDQITLNVLSIFDKDNWVEPSDKSKINIALHHGSISGCETDLGWKMTHGENDISIFKEYDFAFLGDIHKTNQILDKNGRIRYPGSTIQQNHGETRDKGFLVWNIDNKQSFTCKHIEIHNPCPFVTVKLTSKGKLPKNVKIPQGVRLRLVSNNNLPLNTMKKAVEVARHRFKPESITFLNHAANGRGSIEDLSGGAANDNLRDVVVQETLIKEYLKDYRLNSDLLQRVFKLNSKYNSDVEQFYEVDRNVNWTLDSIEWSNLFNYGENNKINFNKLSGIVGIFGKNFSGKSSIIDSILYVLYNSTSKNERKNLNIINQNKNVGAGTANISIGNKKYTVQRKSEKYVKKLKGEETLEAKTDVDFECYHSATEKVEVLNEITRSETDRNIRKHFGTLEDFLLTSMSSQLGALQFISEGSTRRKEILAKFLDLEIFDKKYKLAKEDAADLRGALKRLEGKEFDDDIFAVEKDIIFNESQTRSHSESCEMFKKERIEFQQKADEIQKSIDSIPTEVIDIKQVIKYIGKKEKECGTTIADIINLKDELIEKEGLIEKIDNFINSFNVEELHDKKEIASEKLILLDNINKEVDSLKKETKNKERKIQLLKEVPCGDQYPNCKFICDAHSASSEVVNLTVKVTELNRHYGEVDSEIKELNLEQIEDYLQKYQEVLNKKEDSLRSTATTTLLIEKNEITLKSLEKEAESLGQQKNTYYDNKDIIDNKGSFIKELNKVKNSLLLKEKKLEECQEALLGFYKEHGSLEQKLNSLKEEKQELLDLREEYSAYDLYMRCMHSNGIAYDIIKKKLPLINNEIAKILVNVVSFEVFFDADDRHLRIFIKHPKHEPRPLEMGSGAEKTIAAMAIRLGLWKVSNLPKSNIFILDEPGTSLDADNMDGFVAILELVKSYFKTVLLISHLDSLKDCVDMEITIDKDGDYARVNEV